ncbi:flagellar hook-length control protein FliK [Dyella lutea]|uniref:Flagellar hook-length control protein FliK n=1 Tax=Dyella lutea TaxID=2950441 RepID=A0ABT1F8S0_9GAMM|nr:flagellar hook-length control protein FliK [Dyella lutea]MCP1373770.1 flagellar hook-length control protein FliK [Dyella lutea]
MPATAPLPKISVAMPSAAAPASESRAGSGDAARVFDSHLDAARQQQSGKDAARSIPDTASRADTGASKPTPKSADSQPKADDPKDTAKAAADQGSAATTTSLVAGVKTQATTDDTADGSDGPTDKPAAHDDDASASGAASVAGAMLALLGQAMPANASVVTGGAAKVMAASILKASLGGPAAVDATVSGSTDPAAVAATASDSTTATDAGPTAIGTGQTLQGLASFNDLFASGLPKAAMRQDDKSSIDALAGLMQAGSPAASAPLTAAPHALTITSQVGSADFTQQLGQQVAWLGGQDIKQARIKLHPEELGSLDVKVSVQHNGQVDVTFAAQHPATVHALQQTLPQLDTLLAQQGLSLGQAQVGQQSAGGGDGSRSSSSSGGAGDATDAAIGEVAAAPATISAVGLLDAFA